MTHRIVAVLLALLPAAGVAPAQPIPAPGGVKTKVLGKLRDF